MKLLGGSWSKGDFFAMSTLLVGILAIPGMPKVFHWDNDKRLSRSESVVAQSVVPAPVAESSHPAVKHRPVKERSARVAEPTTQVFNNNGINNGIQNNCPFGDCDQSVHFGADSKPLPLVSFDQSPLPPEDRTRKLTREDLISGAYSLREGDARYNPGALVGIRTNRIFDDPAFEITCDAPCDITQASLGSKDANMMNIEGIHPISYVSTPNGIKHRISFAPKLVPGSWFNLNLRSRSDRPITVTSIVSISSDEVVPSTQSN